MEDLRGRGAEAIILGCTEIPLLIKQADTDIPLFDSTHIHVNYALDFALSD
jgi:aspartate racemase